MIEQPVTAFPLGVADPDRGVACVSRYDGGVELLRLADGGPVWKWDGGLAPLAMARGRILVRAPHRVESVLALALLDVQDGSPVASLDAVLPHGVETGRRDFSLRATVTEREFLLHWRQPPRYRGGAYPRGGGWRDAGSEDSTAGTLGIDIASGALRQGPAIGNSAAQLPPPRSVALGGTNYMLTDDLALEARDTISGTLRWRRELGAVPLDAPPPQPE